MSQSPLTTTESHVAGRTRQLVEAPITPTLLRLAMAERRGHGGPGYREYL